LTWLNRSLEILPRFGKPPGPSRIPTATPNTFYSERENPTFESPVSSSRSILDMMFQCWSGVIRVFPAMPTIWKDASFYHLRAEGAFLVSAVRKNGLTKFIEVKSLAGEPCVLQTDFKGEVHVLGVEKSRMGQQASRISLKLRKGETAILYVGEKPIDLNVRELASKRESWNAWGVAK